MKMIQIIFICLVLPVSFLQVAQADEKQGTSGQAEEEMTGSEKTVYAESLFTGRCQMCHQLPEPGMLRPHQWKLILVTMQQRMQQAGVPPLTEKETELLLAYLAERAR